MLSGRGWPRRRLGEGWGQCPPRTESPSPQAVILEGNYWKRRIEVVMREYHKWRIYYKKRVSGEPFSWGCGPPPLAKALEGDPPTLDPVLH